MFSNLRFLLQTLGGPSSDPKLRNPVVPEAEASLAPMASLSPDAQGRASIVRILGSFIGLLKGIYKGSI